MHQGVEFLYSRSLDAVKAHDAVSVFGVNAVQKKHVKVNIQIQRRAEALNQGDGTCMGSVCLLTPAFLTKWVASVRLTISSTLPIMEGC